MTWEEICEAEGLPADAAALLAERPEPANAFDTKVASTRQKRGPPPQAQAPRPDPGLRPDRGPRRGCMC